MATYVLVGGAWLGGWVWQRVARSLRAQGHDVYPVTLTGLGERAHLAHPEIDLETHITDVVNLIAYEDLADVILVGHSYAGSVVTGVADRVGERLAKLAYLDSAPLDDGESLLDFNPPDEQVEMRRQVADDGEGWRLAPPPFAQLPASPSLEGLGDAERALLDAKTVAQPFGTYTQPLRRTKTDPTERRYEQVIILCNDGQALMASGLPRFLAFDTPDWRRHDLATGHWPMLSLPDELADLLHRLAAEA